MECAQCTHTHQRSRALIAGLAGEPTDLTIKGDGTLDTMGIVDNCTHLGCTFPWNPVDQQHNSNAPKCPSSLG